MIYGLYDCRGVWGHPAEPPLAQHPECLPGIAGHPQAELCAPLLGECTDEAPCLLPLPTDQPFAHLGIFINASCCPSLPVGDCTACLMQFIRLQRCRACHAQSTTQSLTSCHQVLMHKCTVINLYIPDLCYTQVSSKSCTVPKCIHNHAQNALQVYLQPVYICNCYTRSISKGQGLSSYAPHWRLFLFAGAQAVPAVVQLCERAAIQPAAAAAGVLQLQQWGVCQDRSG